MCRESLEKQLREAREKIHEQGLEIANLRERLEVNRFARDQHNKVQSDGQQVYGYNLPSPPHLFQRHEFSRPGAYPQMFSEE